MKTKREELFKRFKDGLPFAFKDEGLLERVFVHSSYLNERGGKGLVSNERLEFLGDAVLSSIISHILYERYAELEEGELTRIRARLVNRRTLARLARDLDLGPLMLLGKGERKSGGMENPTILSNAFEALVAAVYLDRGYRTTFSFIERMFSPLIESSIDEAGHFDYKPGLQELTQRHFKKAPVYRVVKEEGPAHRRFFTIEVVIGGKVLGRGTATRKKDAEQISAHEALERLKKKGYTLKGL